MGPGDVVAGRFELLELAARGGVGSVHRARDQQTGAIVAVKLTTGVDPQNRARFGREASLLAELVHPRIAAYVAHGLEGDVPYLVMQWVEGESLAQRLRRGPISVLDATVVVRGACEGLAAAHARGVVHRDVKPGNLMLQDGALDHVVLVDFGIARRAVATLVTPRGSAIGTPGYMSPEQVRGEARIDARADVFALGCVLYRCVAGRPPFTGNDVVATLAKVLFEEPPHLSDLVPSVPRVIGDLVQTLLRKDPERRPADAAAVLETLDGLAHMAPATTREGRLPATLGHDEVRVLCAVACSLHPIDPSRGDPLTQWSGAVRTLRDATAPFRGRFEALASGAVVITLDPVGSVSDQAARAGRLALALAETGEAEQRGLAMGRGSLIAPVGEVIDRAVALMRAAQPGATRVDDGAASLIEGRFELSGPAGARVLVAERHASDVRGLSGKVPLVGRERELGVLERLYAECVEERACRCAHLVGTAGVGKTRLVAELVRRTGTSPVPPVVWRADGDALTTSSPLVATGEMLRDLAGVRRSDGRDVRRTKVHAWANAHGADARAQALLGELAGVATEADNALLHQRRLDRVAMNDALQRAWVDLVRACASRGPLLFVVDDVQWVDLSTLKLVVAAVSATEDLPLMLVAVGRPDDETFTRLLGERPLARTTLRELPSRAATELARALLPTAPDDAIERLVRTAAGNPLVLEELARVGPKQSSAPETVLSMAEERLANLDTEVRRALRAASVLGGRFESAEVAAVLGDAEVTTTRALTAAAERAVLVATDGAYAFNHALLREASYATLTSEDRRTAHGRAAELLTARNDADAVRVAEHWERSGRPAEAVSWYARGAERSLALSDCAGALAIANRGVACGAKGDWLARLELLAAEALGWQGSYEAARERAERAMAVAGEGAPEWYLAATQAIVASARLGDNDGVAAIAGAVAASTPRSDALAAATVALARAVSVLVHAARRDLGERYADVLERWLPANAPPLVRVRAREARANIALAREDPTTYVDLMEEVARTYAEGGAVRAACHARINVGHVLSTNGAGERAARLLLDALADARSLRVPFLVCAAQHNLGMAFARAGRLDEALETERAAVEAAKLLGDARVLGGSHTYTAQILLLRGDAAGARAEALEAVRLLDPHRALSAQALGVMAEAIMVEGDFGAALSATDRAMHVIDEHGGTLEEGEAQIRLVHARALHAASRIPEAREVIARAVRRLDERVGTLRGDLALAFESLPEHVRTRALARAWA